MEIFHLKSTIQNHKNQKTTTTLSDGQNRFVDRIAVRGTRGCMEGTCKLCPLQIEGNIQYVKMNWKESTGELDHPEISIQI